MLKLNMIDKPQRVAVFKSNFGICIKREPTFFVVLLGLLHDIAVMLATLSTHHYYSENSGACV
jgi:hypothetical protein